MTPIRQPTLRLHGLCLTVNSNELRLFFRPMHSPFLNNDGASDIETTFLTISLVMSRNLYGI